ncbi:MAG: helix-turn-helix transcriptional regulator [Thermovirgaceae bacterium]
METILKKARKGSGHTLRSLEAVTGIKYSRMSRLENRQERVWRGDIERLGKVLDFPEDGVVDENGMAKLAE